MAAPDISSFNFMESSSTAELFVHGVTDTCSFLDAPFLYSKGVEFFFWGGGEVGISLIFVG